MKRCVLLCVLALCLAGGNAFADVVPPDVAACDGKSEGDACKTTDSKDGKCQKAKCSRATPNGNEEYDCTKCVAGSTNDPLPSESSTSNDAGSGAGDKGTGGDKVATTPPKTGCDIAGNGTRLGMGLILLFLGLLAAWRMAAPTPATQPVKKRAE